MSEKEFDRGKCFTFFASYRKQGERIKEILGPEKALEYYEAVIDYGLYAKPIDNNLLLYVGDHPILNDRLIPREAVTSIW